MLLLLLAVEGNRMEIEYLCITYVKFICLLLINLLNAAAFFFFSATEFKIYVGPNSRNSYGMECQSQMSSGGPLIFGLGWYQVLRSPE